MTTTKVLLPLFTATVLTAYSAETLEIGPPPGKLADIGERKLHIDCSGTGAPTVVLEAGASSYAIDWSLVQPEIARITRVCSYDRAGYGWSEKSEHPETPEQVARDLHALLQAAGEKAPYVLVGASMGGIYARIFQLQYPKEVAGMVFVDPSHEDRLFEDVDGKSVPVWAVPTEHVRNRIPPFSGTLELPVREPQRGPPFDRLSPKLLKIRIAFDKRFGEAHKFATHAQLLGAEVGRHAAFVKLHENSLAQKYPLANQPVVVLTRGSDSNKHREAVHATLARYSTNSRHTIVAGAGHEIHLFKPAAVIQAIRDVVEAVRAGTMLPLRE